MAALLLLYLVCSAAVLYAARFLRLPIPARAAWILVLLPILFFLPGFVTSRTPVPVDHCLTLPPWSTLAHAPARNANLNDVARQFLPWAQAAREAWKAGSIPGRDRWNGCGTPLSANGTSAVYAPWTLLSMLLPLSAAFTYAAALKLLLALTGTWLWARESGLSSEAALLGAILFGFCLSMTLWLFWPQSSMICLWPWVWFLIERLRGDRDRRAWWALVFVFVLWPLAGHLESAASGLAFTGLWLLGRVVLGERGLLRAAPRILGAGFAALGLAAFALAPQVLAILASNRLALVANPFWAPLLSATPHGPRWPEVFWTTLFPRALGDGIASPMLSRAPAAFPELALGSIGVIGWCVAFLFFLPGERRDPRARALLVPLIAGLAAASLLWPFGELVAFAPGLRWMFPVRFLAWAAAAGSALAAFELDRLARRTERSPKAARWLLAPASLFAVGAAVSFALLRSPHRLAGGAQSQTRALLVAEAVLFGLAAWAVLRGSAKISHRAFLLGVAALAAAEVSYQGARFYQYGDPRGLYPPMPLIRFLQARMPPFRVLGEGAYFFPNSNVFARMEEVRTHDPAERRDYVEFLDRTCGYAPDAYFKDIRDVNAPALDFLNVRYLVSSADRVSPGPKWRLVYRAADGSVFENAQVLPRAFAPRRLVWIREEGRAGRPIRRNAVANFGSAFDRIARVRDWQDAAYLLGPSSGEQQNAAASVSDYRESDREITFRVSAAGAGPVVVLSVVQDGGWTARDESSTRLAATVANGPFLAVTVQGGDHRVVLSYVEPGLVAGGFCSLLTALMLSGVGLVRRFSAARPAVRSRAEPPQEEP